MYLREISISVNFGIFQAIKQLATLIPFDGEKNNMVEEEFSFQRALGIAQHHDGVSGTEKQHVTDDYALYLDEGLEKGKKIITEVYRYDYKFAFFQRNHTRVHENKLLDPNAIIVH